LIPGKTALRLVYEDERQTVSAAATSHRKHIIADSGKPCTSDH